MDARHFDSLTRVLSGSDSRRKVLVALAALPVVGGLLGIATVEEASAHGRRQRRKKRHKHGKGRRRTNRRGAGKKTPPTCVPESAAQTCAGRCGSVKNTCQQTVECGACGAGQVCCDGQCLEGACCTAAECTSAQAPDCVNQACVCAKNGNAVCTAGKTCCANGCTDLKVDVDNCGTCEHACDAGQLCRNGACTCIPDCNGKQCGDDGCGGQCGTCTGALPVCSVDQQCTCPAGSSLCGGFCVPDSCGEGGSLDGCSCLCPPGVGCIPGSVCAPAPTYCVAPPGWQYCEAQGPNRRFVPPCPAGQTLSQETCLCS